MIRPSEDGITHVNIYSKGQTDLGRFLSNFAYAPIEIEDGHFDSMEGYWYWLSSKDDALRYKSGWDAKRYGRSIEAKDWMDGDEFKNKIRHAIRVKLETYPDRLDELRQLRLPLMHYYVYGGKAKNAPQAWWIVDYLESFKEN